MNIPTPPRSTLFPYTTLFRSLARPLADGSYEGELAEEVPTTKNGGVSADGKTVTWKLRKGVLWSDGKPFTDRKSTRLNSSHLVISYAVFCLKKKSRAIVATRV